MLVAVVSEELSVTRNNYCRTFCKDGSFVPPIDLIDGDKIIFYSQFLKAFPNCFFAADIFHSIKFFVLKTKLYVQN